MKKLDDTNPLREDSDNSPNRKKSPFVDGKSRHQKGLSTHKDELHVFGEGAHVRKNSVGDSESIDTNAVGKQLKMAGNHLAGS